MDLAHKHISVLGAGSSGIAAARLAKEKGAASVTVRDTAPADRFPAERVAEWRALGLECRLGEADAFLREDEQADLALISPGIALTAPLPQCFAQRGIPVLGEIEFASRFWDREIIGLTGTNGKTTTIEIIAAILNACGQPTLPAGNYGNAFADVARERPDDVVASLELSSFQLETIETFHPQIAVWTNFATDHMDRYATLEEYRAAKLRLFENQTEADWAVVNAADMADMPPLRASVLTFSAFDLPADFTLRNQSELYFRDECVADLKNTRLRGRHNAENLLCAFAVGHLRGCSFPQMAEAVAAYEPPPHRSELVGEINGHECINDSKATNLHALQSCLRSQEEPVILIAGGKYKGFDYVPLQKEVRAHVSHAVTIGEIADRIARDWDGVVPCSPERDLRAALQRALELASPGQTILFSPGTSSFDMFSSYVERGNVFKELVKEMAS